MTKEQLAPNFWELIKVWNNNPNDEQIKELESKLTKEEKSYFQFHKIAKEILCQKN